MAKFPKYICFKVVIDGLTVDLEQIQPCEMEETAHWKRCEDEYCYWFECSNCGNGPPYTRYKQEILSNYCPHCGCLMLEDDYES